MVTMLVTQEGRGYCTMIFFSRKTFCFGKNATFAKSEYNGLLITNTLILKYLKMKKETNSANLALIKTQEIEARLIELRDQRVLIDRDVAELYGVETRRVNEAVKNNLEKFPDGYSFTLQNTEKQYLVENFDRFKPIKNSTVEPRAFTEKGLYMLATILKSERATMVTIAIIETFAKVRELKRELIELHKETDKSKKNAKMLTDIVMPDLETSVTESTLELNFFIGKIKHTVKRVKKEN